MEEIRDLDKLLRDFCDASDLYPYESVKININALRGITKESMILILEPYYYEHLKSKDAVF